MNPAIDVRPYTPGDFPALADLFGRAGASNGCWCLYWRLGPRYHERDRAANRRDRSELTSGLLAYEDSLAVGWCELAPRADFPWLVRRLDPVDDLPVWSLPCFYIRRSHRGRGVTRALIEAAVKITGAAGAPALEAYPIDTSVPGHTRNLFPGVASTFAECGFVEVARRAPYRPVMRLRTEPRAADR
jgi:GNAT superfamily N-acetyltransferase